MYDLSERQIATILAALWLLQDQNALDDPYWSIATNLGEFTRLTPTEVDVLCEYLNFGGE